MDWSIDIDIVVEVVVIVLFYRTYVNRVINLYMNFFNNEKHKRGNCFQNRFSTIIISISVFTVIESITSSY